jgi:hypothetical protein
VCPVRYDLAFYIPENGILHSHRRGNFKPYIRFSLVLLCSLLSIVKPVDKDIRNSKTDVQIFLTSLRNPAIMSSIS